MRTARNKQPGTRRAPQEDVVLRALERFRETLRRRGQRYSMVREAIARAALGYEGHFEVNDLVSELRQAGIEEAHLATVYRTLPLLIEAGIIQQTLLSSGERHFYEPAFERPHHAPKRSSRQTPHGRPNELRAFTFLTALPCPCSPLDIGEHGRGNHGYTAGCHIPHQARARWSIHGRLRSYHRKGARRKRL